MLLKITLKNVTFKFAAIRSRASKICVARHYNNEKSPKRQTRSYLAISTARPGRRAFGFFGQFARDRVATRVVLQAVVEPATIALFVLLHYVVTAFLLRVCDL